MLCERLEQHVLLGAELRRRPVCPGDGDVMTSEQGVHDHRWLATGRAVEALADVADVLAHSLDRQLSPGGDFSEGETVHEVLRDAMQGWRERRDRCAGRHGRGHRYVSSRLGSTVEGGGAAGPRGRRGLTGRARARQWQATSCRARGCDSAGIEAAMRYRLRPIPPRMCVGSGEVSDSGRHRLHETMPGGSSSRPS